MKTSQIGIILIAIGAMIMLGNFGFMEGSLFLVVVGAMFLLGYFRSERKPIGLLIPGTIILAVAAFSSLENVLGFLEGPVFFLFLGSAFMGVHIIHQQHTTSEKSTRWALLTGLGMMAFGGFVFLTDLPSLPIFYGMQQYVWPIILIGAGAYMIFGKGSKPKQKDF